MISVRQLWLLKQDVLQLQIIQCMNIYRPVPLISAGTHLPKQYNQIIQNQLLQRESVKGLFTFYREQNQAENQLIIANNSNHVIRVGNNGKQQVRRRGRIEAQRKVLGKKLEISGEKADDISANQSKNQGSQGVIRDKHSKSRHKKLLKSKNASRTKAVSQDNKDKPKKKKKAQQLFKNKINDPLGSQTETVNAVTQKSLINLNNEEDPTHMFLKQVIKRRINRPSSRKLRTMQEEVISSQKNALVDPTSKNSSMKHLPDRQKSEQQTNRYIFPFKSAKQSKLKTDISEPNVLQKYQLLNYADKVNSLTYNKNRMHDLNANDNGNDAEATEYNIRQKQGSRHHRYTDPNDQDKNISNSMNIKVRNNFFSDHRTKILKKSIELKYDQDDSLPISPATRIATPKSKPNQIPMKQTSSCKEMKLPLIKMSRQLRKIQQITQQAHNQKIYSNKSSHRMSKNNGNQIEGSPELKTKDKNQMRNRKKDESKKKIHCDLERCQLALIDMSRSETKQVNQKRDQGLTNEKKLIFKKLGLKI